MCWLPLDWQLRKKQVSAPATHAHEVQVTGDSLKGAFDASAELCNPGAGWTARACELWKPERTGFYQARTLYLVFLPSVPAGCANCFAEGITSGPDHTLWFTEGFGAKIGRITVDGRITEFSDVQNGLPIGNSYPYRIVSGPDGTLWFTGEFGDIGQITPNGTITEFTPPTYQRLQGITLGPDSALWFTEANPPDKIGRIMSNGAITEFPLPADTRPDFDELEAIVTGPDGALWFTEGRVNKIGRITLDGHITEFPLPHAESEPGDITVGPDGALWFTEAGRGAIGRLTPTGSLTEFPANAPVGAITAGPDGNLWFTAPDRAGGTNHLGRLTPSGVVTLFDVPECPGADFFVNQLTTGPDGNLWFTANRCIGRFAPKG